MKRFVRALTAWVLMAAGAAMAQSPSIGMVIMHGKGGSPTKHVDGLARALSAEGFLVANLEMPWSGRRDYDVDVSGAEQEVESALAALRAKGAQKVFVAGHSQGGAFAVYFAGKYDIDGVIAIAPGGDTGSPLFRDKLGESLARARQAMAEGKGEEKLKLLDYEGSRGTTPILATAAAYVSWFDPQGAMNLAHTALVLKPQTPVLWIVAKYDYPALRRVNLPLYRGLAPNPLNELYEPNSSHLDAPAASTEEILRWTREVARARGH